MYIVQLHAFHSLPPCHSTMEDRDQLLLAAQLLLDDDRFQNEAAARDAAEDSDSNDGDGYDDDGGGDGDAPGAPAGRRRRRRIRVTIRIDSGRHSGHSGQIRLYSCYSGPMIRTVLSE